MYMQAITIRIAYLAVLSVGVVLAAAFRDSTVQAAPAADIAMAAAPAASAPPVVTLPAVHVRAVAAREPAAVRLPEKARIAGLASERSAGGGAGSALPSLRLDMPYYAFGKLLPRVGKE